MATFTHDDAERGLSELSEELNIKKAELIHPTRLAVSGFSSGPGLYDILAILEKPEVVRRLRRAVEYIRNKKTY
jgi:glutamyl-tRNA synthetase